MAINSIAQAAYLSNLRDKDLIEQGSRNVGSSNSFKSTVEESLKKS